METEPRRILLGWNQPFLVSVAKFLLTEYRCEADLDLSDVLVVLPGLRPGRRLVEILVDLSQVEGLLLVPPRTVTPASLIDRFHPRELTSASSLAQRCAWAAALQKYPPASLNNLFPNPPGESDVLGWLALGDLVARVHREVVGDGLTFAEVGKSAEGDPRWQILEELRRFYRQILAEAALVDKSETRLAATLKVDEANRTRIVLAGVADADSRIVRQLLRQIAPWLTVLIHAPNELDDAFDAFGFLRHEWWRERPIDIPAENYQVCDGPEGQAEIIASWLEATLSHHSSNDVVIGVPDRSLVPAIEHRLLDAGVNTHDAAGISWRTTAVSRLIELSADYVERRRFSELAALVRHPDLYDRLATSERGRPMDWPMFLDGYRQRHLQVTIPRRKNATDPLDLIGSEKDRLRLEQLITKLDAIYGPLAGEHRLPLNRWPEAIQKFLLHVYGTQPLNPRQPADQFLIDLFQRVQKGLEELNELHDSLAPRVTAGTALRILSRQLSRADIAGSTAADAIELLGWLELPLDDAPALIIVGMNDGKVPESLNADLFLPNTLRKRVGLLDNDQRYARDAYALSAILGTRPDTKLVCGRRSVEGDPLSPSRLLLACPDQTLIDRVKQFFRSHDPQANRPNRGGAPVRRRTQLPVPPPRDIEIPNHLGVTAFRAYLACPYRFYLRHILHLKALDDALEEMDAAAFGTLAHDVLHQFGESDVQQSTNIKQIRDFLHSTLRQQERELYGADPLPAIRLQVQNLASRLDGLAEWQANHVAEGWRIAHVEHAVEGDQACFPVDRQDFFLRGRIDRIDINDRTGEILLLDYKTSDTAVSPESNHRTKDGAWIDLQLPLYRHLLATLGLRGSIRMGYVRLPKRTEKNSLLLADWSHEDLTQADQFAAQVIRNIRERRFWPPVAPPPSGFAELAAICQDDRLLLLGDEEEEEMDSVAP